jgi:hypothetical protein
LLKRKSLEEKHREITGLFTDHFNIMENRLISASKRLQKQVIQFGKLESAVKKRGSQRDEETR